MQKNSRKIALIGLIFVGIIALGVFGFSKWKEARQREQDYQDGIAAIDAGDYELAVDLLEPLKENAAYPDMDMLLVYAHLLKCRANNSDINIQSSYANGYDSSYDGLYASELADLVQKVEEEYEAYCAQQEAEKQKFMDELAGGIPYEGMNEKYISSTIVGRYDTKDSYKHSKTKTEINTYRWYAETGDLVLKVKCYNGYVSSVDQYYLDVYWNADGTPHFDSKLKSSNNKSSSYGNGYVDSYDSGYDDVYFDEEYDTDRYDSDQDYADGVDDAMDEIGEYW